MIFRMVRKTFKKGKQMKNKTVKTSNSRDTRVTSVGPLSIKVTYLPELSTRLNQEMHMLSVSGAFDVPEDPSELPELHPEHAVNEEAAVALALALKLRAAMPSLLDKVSDADIEAALAALDR